MADFERIEKLIQLGEKQYAFKGLTEILKKDPKNVTAWLLLAQAVDDQRKEMDCYKQVLRIDPENAQAKAGLEKYFAQPAPAAPPAPPVEEAVHPAEGVVMDRMNSLGAPEILPERFETFTVQAPSAEAEPAYIPPVPIPQPAAPQPPTAAPRRKIRLSFWEGLLIVLVGLLLLAFVGLLFLNKGQSVDGYLFSAAELSCLGQAAPQAAEYTPGSGLHPVVIVYNPYLSGYSKWVDPAGQLTKPQYPEGWLPASSQQWQLTACVDFTVPQALNCEYLPSSGERAPKIADPKNPEKPVLVQFSLSSAIVHLYSAKDGKKLESFTVFNTLKMPEFFLETPGKPSCPAALKVNNGQFVLPDTKSTPDSAMIFKALEGKIKP
jgi:hypothetical protein